MPLRRGCPPISSEEVGGIAVDILLVSVLRNDGVAGQVFVESGGTVRKSDEELHVVYGVGQK